LSILTVPAAERDGGLGWAKQEYRQATETIVIADLQGLVFSGRDRDGSANAGVLKS
jgi:hypothetical protein